MAMATFISNTDNTTFYVFADNSTVAALVTTIDQNCTSYLSSSSSSSPVLIGDTSTSAPQPVQAVQYYRASSVVLSLAGYNNSAGATTPLPSNTNANLLGCLNLTIGESVPLINGGASLWASPAMSMLGVIWAIWFLLGATV